MLFAERVTSLFLLKNVPLSNVWGKTGLYPEKKNIPSHLGCQIYFDSSLKQV